MFSICSEDCFPSIFYSVCKISVIWVLFKPTVCGKLMLFERCVLWNQVWTQLKRSYYLTLRSIRQGVYNHHYLNTTPCRSLLAHLIWKITSSFVLFLIPSIVRGFFVLNFLRVAFQDVYDVFYKFNLPKLQIMFSFYFRKITFCYYVLRFPLCSYISFGAVQFLTFFTPVFLLLRNRSSDF